MNEQKEKGKKGAWGGARAGSGRPKSVAKKVGFCATADVAEILSKVSSKSEFICEAIRRHHAFLSHHGE